MKSAPSALRGRIRRGTVLFLRETDLDDGRYQGASKPKFCVVINLKPQEDPIIYLHSTSQIDPYSGGRWDADILPIPKGSYPFFPEETIISIRNHKQKTITELHNLEAKGQLKICGALTEEHLRELNTKIRCSSMLPTKVIKKTALPE